MARTFEVQHRLAENLICNEILEQCKDDELLASEVERTAKGSKVSKNETPNGPLGLIGEAR
jgi:hypothetical protein